MRGSIKIAVSAALAAALLAACTSNNSSAGSSSSPAPATSSSSAAPASSSPAVTVPPVASPTLTAPVTTSSALDNSTSSSTATSSTATPSTATPTPTPPKVVLPAAKVAANPKLGSTDISPRTAINIKASDGTLSAVSMTNAEGAAVKGTMSADKTTWTLAEPLGYSATYSISGKAVGKNGKPVDIKGSYTTISPDDLINASISPSDGDTVGIAAPILISLGTDVDDTTGRQNIEKAITVSTVPKTEGSFAWIHHDDGWGLDWRPKSYWKPGTKITVSANLYGVNFGNNTWGKEDVTSSFTIGRAEITKGDIQTHRLKVYRDGKLLFDFPTSFGLESDPGRVTRNGTYIVMSKEYLHLMSNPKYGYKDFKAYYAVRINNDGTFIHANDGTADVQGYENVTHGCANLTMTNAQLFYDQTMYGDPVEITGSSLDMSTESGDYYDWSIPWAQWQAKSALSKNYAG